jgi:hypothetical protein
VRLLSPNGGEIISAGSPQYPITWEAPREAVKFKLRDSMGRRIGNGFIHGNNILWNVPLFPKNKNNFFIKITAYDSADKKIGYDSSDNEFTIEVVSLSSPDNGNSFTAGQVCRIVWTKSEYAPAASVELSYSLNNGFTWHALSDNLPGNTLYFDWTTPNVSEPKTKCKVKIVLRDSGGKIVGSDVSDGNFTILPEF